MQYIFLLLCSKHSHGSPDQRHYSLVLVPTCPEHVQHMRYRIFNGCWLLSDDSRASWNPTSEMLDNGDVRFCLFPRKPVAHVCGTCQIRRVDWDSYSWMIWWSRNCSFFFEYHCLNLISCAFFTFSACSVVSVLDLREKGKTSVPITSQWGFCFVLIFLFWSGVAHVYFHSMLCYFWFSACMKRVEM